MNEQGVEHVLTRENIAGSAEDPSQLGDHPCGGSGQLRVGSRAAGFCQVLCWGRRGMQFGVCSLSCERDGCGQRRRLLGWETVEGSVDRCRRSDGGDTQRGEKVRGSDFRGGGVLPGDCVRGVGGQDAGQRRGWVWAWSLMDTEVIRGVLHTAYLSWQRLPVCRATWVARVVGGGREAVGDTGRDWEVFPL